MKITFRWVHLSAACDRPHHAFCFSVLQRNVKEMMDVSGIRVLVDLLTLAHLHTSRAVVPLQVICHMCCKTESVYRSLRNYMFYMQGCQMSKFDSITIIP